MKPLFVTLLGGLDIRMASGQIISLPTKKTLALLGYLALHPGKAYPRDRLAALLWGDSSDEQARRSLRQAMYVLRKALPETEPPALLMEGETIALNGDAVDVDTSVFERLVSERTPEALERAVALYRGELLEGVGVDEAPFAEWLASEQERLRGLAVQAFTDILAHQSKAGQTQQAIQTAVTLLAMDVSQEIVHRALMRLYARQGRRGAALKQYQVCVAALQRELGTEPEPETKQLYQEILQRRASEPLKFAAPEPTHRRESRRPSLESRSELITPDSPLIGREVELVRLREALEKASRGDGQVVAITGEAGIGKSSLLMALATEAHARGIRILLGRSYQTEQVLAFGPWVDAFRNGCVVAEVEVFGGLAPLWRAELARLLPQLEVEGAEPAAHPPDHLLLFEAATELIRSLATKEPVVVMLEDVHWADEMSLRLMAFLARRIRSSPILVVMTIRDEEVASAPVLGQVVDELSRESHFVPLALTPLSRASTIALVRSLVSASTAGVDARLDAEIWRASTGNPFLVVETIRAIQEGVAPRTPATLPLPERVRRVVAGRLERLSDRGRHLASVAAVVGREFDFALLQRAAGLDERHAAEGVEELVRRRVLQGFGEQLDFTHEWIREIVYNELVHPRRKRLHVLVAKALEDLHAADPERHYAALAGHYRAGEVWEKALVCLRQAGARAMRLSAYRDAVTCFEQALEAVPRLPKTRETLETAVDVRFDLRNALLPLAEFDRVRGYLRDAEALVRSLDDRRRLGWLSVYVSHDSRLAGSSTEAAERAAAAQTLGDALGDSSLRIAAEFQLGAARFSLGDHRRAVDVFRRIARSLDDDLNRRHVGYPEFPAVVARAWLAQSLAELGEFDEGIAFGEEGIRLAEALDHAMSLAYACTRLAHLYTVKGELDRAAVLLERGHALTRDWKITYTAALATADLGYVYALRGRHDEGLSLLCDAMNAYESMKVDVVKPRLLVRLGEAYLLVDRVDKARVCAEQCLAYTRARGEHGYEAYALYLLGETAARQDSPGSKAAEEHLREAGSLAADLGMRPLVGHCHRGLGTLYRRTGQPPAAREHLAAAAAIFQHLAMGSWLEKAEAELRQRD